MGLMLSAMTLLVLSACVFVPIFAVALFMGLRAMRAFALSGVFTFGAVVGAMASGPLAKLVLGRNHPQDIRELYATFFLAAAAAAGGVIAVWLLGKFSSKPPWSRD
jgi:hypothetical protein